MTQSQEDAMDKIFDEVRNQAIDHCIEAAKEYFNEFEYKHYYISLFNNLQAKLQNLKSK